MTRGLRTYIMVGMTRILDRAHWPVQTERLTLRPSLPGDADAVWAYRSLDSVAEWIGRLEGSREQHAARFTEPDNLETTVIVEKQGEVVGDLYFHVVDPWAQHEVADRAAGTQATLGWTLAPDHEGHGYATEAVRALIEVAFTDLGLRRVFAECFAANAGSWRLMERVGMRREQYAVRDSLHRTRGWLDGMTYALLAEEWAEQQGHHSENRSGSASV